MDFKDSKPLLMHRNTCNSKHFARLERSQKRFLTYCMLIIRWSRKNFENGRKKILTSKAKGPPNPSPIVEQQIMPSKAGKIALKKFSFEISCMSYSNFPRSYSWSESRRDTTASSAINCTTLRSYSTDIDRR